jgi:hypothetical protein
MEVAHEEEGLFVRKIHLLLAALTIVVTSFAAFSGPAMADDWDNDWDHHGNNVVWQSNNGDWDNWDNDEWDGDWWWANDWDEDWDNDWDNSWWGNNWHHGCEGPVCLID